MSSESDDPLRLLPAARPAKRRRLNSSSYLVVLSSDVGEMEELAAEGDNYWDSPFSSRARSSVRSDFDSSSLPSPQVRRSPATSPQRTSQDSGGGQPGVNDNFLDNQSLEDGTHHLSVRRHARTRMILERPEMPDHDQPSYGEEEALESRPRGVQDMLPVPSGPVSPISPFMARFFSPRGTPDMISDLSKSPNQNIPSSVLSTPSARSRRILSDDISSHLQSTDIHYVASKLPLSRSPDIGHGNQNVTGPPDPLPRNLSSPTNTTSSFPLSSPPADLHVRDIDMQDDEPSAPSRGCTEPAIPPEISPAVIPADVLHQLNEPPARVLRQRTSIQKNPYTLERAQYKNLLAQRGMKEAVVRDESRQSNDQRNEYENTQDAWRDAGNDASLPGERFVEHRKERSVRRHHSERGHDRVSSPERNSDLIEEAFRSRPYAVPIDFHNILDMYGGALSDDDDQPPAPVNAFIHQRSRPRIHKSPPRQRSNRPLPLAGTPEGTPIVQSDEPIYKRPQIRPTVIRSPSSIQDSPSITSRRPASLVINLLSSPAAADSPPDHLLKSPSGQPVHLEDAPDGAWTPLMDSPSGHRNPEFSIMSPMQFSSSQEQYGRDGSPGRDPAPSERPSDHSSDSDEGSPAVDFTEKDRLRLRHLGRMMPMVAVNKLLNANGGKDARVSNRRTNFVSANSRDSSPEHLRPGQSTIRRGGGNVEGINVQGDTDSSSESAPIELSDNSTKSDGEVEFLAEHRGVPGPSRNSRPVDSVREGDLIDRMLSRTCYVRPGRTTGGSTRVVTSKSGQTRNETGHKQYNRSTSPSGLQTKLSFVITSRHRQNSRNPRSKAAQGNGNKHRQPEGHSRRTATAPLRNRLHNDNFIFESPPHRHRSRTSDLSQQRPHAAVSSPGQYPNSPIRQYMESLGDERGHRYRPPDRIIRPGPLPGNSHSTVPAEAPIQQSAWDDFSSFSLDFEIGRLVPGLKFVSSSYIGKGKLYDLVNLLSTGVVPGFTLHGCSGLGLQLDPSLSPSEFETILPSVCDALHDWVKGDVRSETALMAADVMRFTSLYITRVLSRERDDTAEQVSESVLKHADHLMQRLSACAPAAATEETHVRLSTLSVQWFALELCIRMLVGTTWPADDGRINSMKSAIQKHTHGLIGLLLELGIQKTMATLKVLEDVVTRDVDDHTVELWVCLVHLYRALDSRRGHFTLGSFMHHLETVIKSKYPSKLTDVRASERIWYTIMAICNLSQFTPSGISISDPQMESHWSLVSTAMSHVQLTSVEAIDRSLSVVALRSRDKYFRLVLKRCILLQSRWRWDMREGEDFLRSLNELFKSRRFSNLCFHESKPDFSLFLSSLNIRRLSDLEDEDTAYGLFLKLLARCADDMRSAGQERRVSKLLKLLIPVGVATFTKDNPATKFELSMLFNRYSALALAIYLEPSAAPGRIKQTRTVLDFRSADTNSRQVCLRAVMYLGILLRHLHINLELITDWMSEMMDILLNDLNVALETTSKVETSQRSHAQDEAETAVCMLLRSITHVITVPSLDPREQENKVYPDVALVRNAWTAQILRSALNLRARTISEVLKYLQSYLVTREKVAPTRNVDGDEEESQDYGGADFDFEDPALLELLDGGAQKAGAATRTAQEMDNEFAHIVDNSISPAIFAMISNLSTSGTTASHHEQWSIVDSAIDCWASCAHVLVSHGIRDWSSYVGQYGTESFNRVMNKADRRRIGLRLMLKALIFDPKVYRRYREDFISIWFQTIVRPQLTIEHTYTSVLFTCDGCEEGLFANVPFMPETGSSVYDIGLAVLRDVRLELLEVVLRNAGTLVGGDAGANHERAKQQRITKNVVMTIPSAMKEYNESLTSSAKNDQELYRELCRTVVNLLQTFVPQLLDDHDVAWLRKVQVYENPQLYNANGIE